MSKDHQNNSIRVFWTNYWTCLLQQYMGNHSRIGFRSCSRKPSWHYLKFWMFHCCCLRVLVTYLTLQNHKEMLLIIDVLKNANQSLLGSFFCHKLCKCTRFSDCPLSSMEQFLALIPRYTSFTFCIDNGFKLLLGRVNFITVLNHSLYISLALVALITEIVSSRLHLGVLIHKPCLHQLDNYGNGVLEFV